MGVATSYNIEFVNRSDKAREGDAANKPEREKVIGRNGQKKLLQIIVRSLWKETQKV